MGTMFRVHHVKVTRTPLMYRIRMKYANLQQKGGKQEWFWVTLIHDSFNLCLNRENCPSMTLEEAEWTHKYLRSLGYECEIVGDHIP